MTPFAEPQSGEDDVCLFSSELPAYLQGELAPERALDVSEHLDGCKVCRRERDELRELLAGLGDFAPAPVPPPDFADRVMSLVRSAVVSPFKQLGPAGMAFLGMVAATVVLAVFVHEPDRDGGPSPRLDPPVASAGAALRWLVSAQEDDGSYLPSRWGGRDRYRVGLTGLAVSALAGASEGIADASVRDALDRGTSFLIRHQAESGCIGLRINDSLYNHAPATLALLRVQGRHPVAEVRAAAIRAVKHLVSEQRPSGGWGYVDDGRGRANAMISAWPLEALCLAHEAGLADLADQIAAARRWYRTLVDGRGHVGYEEAGSFPHGVTTSTAVGLCFTAPKSEPVDIAPNDCDFIGLYFLAAGDAGARSAIAERVATLQVRTGAFAGSFRPADRWASDGGRVYATSLAVLALEHCRTIPR
ncbi:MAG: hypothetical protein CMJ83_09950 [Planctomycetes bacterium]|nr:hypothetical protein [Planctomycetota bacterium]